MIAVDRIPPGLALLAGQRAEVAVVIDVLRATSTAVALLARGVPRVRVLGTPAELAALASGPARYLVFSELAESRGFGIDWVDNSPAIAEEIDLAGRLPVLVTTNGTRAIAAAVAGADRVLIASFGNLTTTARHLGATARQVALCPAGDFAGCEPRTEDDRCADALEAILAGRQPDLPRLLADCRADPRVQRRIARHPELVRDVEVALSVDRHDVVARVDASSEAGIELVRVVG